MSPKEFIRRHNTAAPQWIGSHRILVLLTDCDLALYGLLWEPVIAESTSRVAISFT